MKNFKYIYNLLVMALVGLSLAACSEDNLDTNQYKGGVSLNAYGPNPVMRGGTLRFVGSNLDQIASIQIPGVAPITNYETVKSGIPSEIRVTVPKDGPTEGVVTLTTKDSKTIQTQSALTYTEPIEFESFSPASAMPGDIVTIKGDYLNLIYSLAFAENVIIGEKDFLTHDRYTITVAVPEDAKTGKIELYTADLTVSADDELDYQIIQSETAIEIGLPTVTQIKGRNTAEPMGNIVCKAGETILIYGSYLNIVEDVTIGGVSAIYMQYVEDKGISCMLPLEAPDGEIMLICKSGVEVPIGTLTTVKPSECVAAPNPVKAGQKLTIKGKDMNIVSSVEFPTNVEGATANAGEIEVTADQVVVKSVPDNAVDGNMLLMMANGMSVEVPFTLVKPTVTGYNVNPVSAGGAIQISGTDLDLIKSIDFGDGQAIVEKDNVSADGTTITVTIPMEATSGKPKFNLANGTSVEGLELSINEAVFCYITELPGDEDTPDAGSVVTVPVKNGDKLTGVTVDGKTVNFVYDEKNSAVTFGIPADAGSQVTVKFISSNGEIEYSMKVIPATSVERVVFTGPIVVDWNAAWPGGRIFITLDQLADIPANAVMHIDFTQHEAWGQVQINYGDWSQIPFAETDGGYLKPELYNDKSVTETDLSFTQEILDNIKAKNGDNGAIIIQGADWTINKISIKWEISLEVDLATLVSNMDGSAISYPYTFTWDDTGRFSLSQDLLLNQIGVKKGSKFLVYKDTSKTGQVQINNSSWTAIEYLTDWSAEKDVMELEFDDTIMEAVNNGGLVIQGAIEGVTKIAILP